MLSRRLALLSSNERWTLGLLSAGIVATFVAAQFSVMEQSQPLCPSLRFLHLHCPGCGLTRACMRLARFEFADAIAYNPMVVFVAGYVVYRLARIGMRLAGRDATRPTWPQWAKRGVEGVFIAGWLLLAVVRTVTWVRPEANPDGFLIPPRPAAATALAAQAS